MGTTMKYLLLIYLAPGMREEWESSPAAEQAEGMRQHATFMEELQASGELVAAEALASESMAKRVRVVDGRTSATDGPFGESKEFLAGLYVVECTSVDRAVELAARLPEASFGHVEVRPVMDPGGLEM